MKLVFATHNMNKFQEVRKLIENKIELLSLNDIRFFNDIEEKGLNLHENAQIKANAVYSHTEVPCFADDTGLLVSCLNGEPGVHSARYAGDDSNDEKNIDLLLENIKGCSDRSACFRTVICLRIDNQHHFFIGETKGTITKSRRGDAGFGYDSIFLPENSKLTYGEMTLKEKNKISHRYKAIEELNTYLISINKISLTQN
ncbi:MAG: RdgB/HAM1 family non-canonical purine NTP pyrophosphatase [Bacteroidia bacterium]|nr:RdgB/HAM1 family non-canonical purine NTP pyrophosphatase [Bacteroidia bacterium]